MWQRTQCPLALESFSFTPQNFFPPLSGEYIDDAYVDKDDKNYVYNDDDNIDDNDGESRDDVGPCFGIGHIYKDELLSLPFTLRKSLN